MVIGFKHRFVPSILDGTKIHTIRTDPHDRWKPGMKMHMATGVRTGQYEQFNQETFRGKQRIEIWWTLSKKAVVHIDGYPVTSQAMLEQLARNDGFISVQDFFFWFNTNYKGYILHWTPLVYNCREPEYKQASLFQL